MDERQLFQLPYLLRKIPSSRILSLRWHTQFMWDTYFSSVNKIIMTTLEVSYHLLLEWNAGLVPCILWTPSTKGVYTPSDASSTTIEIFQCYYWNTFHRQYLHAHVRLGLCCYFYNAEKFRCLYSYYGSCMPSSPKEYIRPCFNTVLIYTL